MNTTEKYIPIANRTNCCKIWLSEILYIVQSHRMITIVTDDDEIKDYCRLKDIECYLDEKFAHCLKTAVVNFENVRAMRDQKIVFINGKTLTLGKHNFINIKQRFVFYMKNPELYFSRVKMSQELKQSALKAALSDDEVRGVKNSKK